MKLILRPLVILLVVAALQCILYAGSSSITYAAAASDAPIATVTADSGWIVTPASVGHISESIPSFFTCIFGVRIFPGADPVGAYSVNKNPDYVPDKPSGKVSGHLYIGLIGNPFPGMVFYLYDNDNHKRGSYFATTDSRGYYEIDHVPFGNYSVFVCNNEAEMQAGSGTLANSITLTASNPNTVVDWLYTFG